MTSDVWREEAPCVNKLASPLQARWVFINGRESQVLEGAKLACLCVNSLWNIKHDILGTRGVLGWVCEETATGQLLHVVVQGAGQAAGTCKV